MRKRIQLALFLLFGLLALNWSVTRVQAQTTPAAELFFDVQSVSAQAGQEVAIPLVVNTHGQTVDGLQVEWQFAGIAVSNVRVMPNASLPFSALKNSADTNGGNLSLVPTNPDSPFSNNESTTVATLYLTPSTTGAMTISYDSTNSLVASHTTNQSILAISGPQTIQVEGNVTPTATTTSDTSTSSMQATPVAQQPSKSNLILMAVAVLIIVAIIGVIIWMMMKRNREKKVMPEEPSTEVTTTQVTNTVTPPLSVAPPAMVNPQAPPAVSQSSLAEPNPTITQPSAPEKPQI